jgi:hypothetical protein
LKLPSNALIASEKLTKYLLVKRPVGDKSEFLKQAGYTLDNWQRLERDIRQHVPCIQTGGADHEVQALSTGCVG